LKNSIYNFLNKKNVIRLALPLVGPAILANVRT